MSKRKEIPDVMSQLQGLGSSPPPPAEVDEQPPKRASIGTPVSRETSTVKRPKAKKRTPKSRLVGRATYDIGKDLKDVIYDESLDLGVPSSQLAKYLLMYAWDFYLKGEIPPPEMIRSNSPKFRNTIDFGE